MCRQPPHIVLVVARGEAVRNFLYSETLEGLSKKARVTLLSVIHDEEFCRRFGPFVEEIVPLNAFQENRLILALRELILYAHYRWMWSAKVRNKWEMLAAEANSLPKKIGFHLWKGLIFLLANRPTLESLAFIESKLSVALKPTDEFDQLFDKLKPDLVFNTSHIHSPAAELPVRIAHKMGIPTAAFVFSWDNLSSRGRILPPYDYFLVWHEGMREQLLSMYPGIDPAHVCITGTPQFDYHFQPGYRLTREQLCARLALDAARPYVLYTTGMDRDFPEEYRFVEEIIRLLQEFEPARRPQLVVRMYVKGISREMLQLSQRQIPDVVFPPVLWDEKWFTPREDDLAMYSSLLHHAHLGINPASTVTLELLMLGKPVINLGFDPPGSQLPHELRWARHTEFDHFQSIARRGVTHIADSLDDLKRSLHSMLKDPARGQEERLAFIGSAFNGTLDGRAGTRVARQLLQLAQIACT